VCFFTCPATANPSASRDDVSQICKQTWNAAICVVPNRAANDAANVTQNVTAITLASNQNPAAIEVYQLNNATYQYLKYNICLFSPSIIYLPFLRNLLNCRSFALGGNRLTSVINLNRRIIDIKYLKET